MFPTPSRKFGTRLGVTAARHEPAKLLCASRRTIGRIDGSAPPVRRWTDGRKYAADEMPVAVTAQGLPVGAGTPSAVIALARAALRQAGWMEPLQEAVGRRLLVAAHSDASAGAGSQIEPRKHRPVDRPCVAHTSTKPHSPPTTSRRVRSAAGDAKPRVARPGARSR